MGYPTILGVFYFCSINNKNKNIFCNQNYKKSNYEVYIGEWGSREIKTKKSQIFVENFSSGSLSTRKNYTNMKKHIKVKFSQKVKYPLIVTSRDCCDGCYRAGFLLVILGRRLLQRNFERHYA